MGACFEGVMPSCNSTGIALCGQNGLKRTHGCTCGLMWGGITWAILGQVLRNRASCR